RVQQLSGAASRSRAQHVAETDELDAGQIVELEGRGSRDGASAAVSEMDLAFLDVVTALAQCRSPRPGGSRATSVPTSLCAQDAAPERGAEGDVCCARAGCRQGLKGLPGTWLRASGSCARPRSASGRPA